MDKVNLWKTEISARLKKQEDFKKQGEKLVKLYRGDGDLIKGKKLNVFSSNTRTLQPAVYGSTPSMVASRRFKDSNLTTRDACEIMERATSFCIDAYNFDTTAKSCRDDMLIVGKGVAWSRYEYELGEPIINPIYETQISEFGEEVEVQTGAEEVPNVVFEKVCCDYVYWDDFICSGARRWEDVTYVGKRAYLSREEIKERFGEEVAAKIKMSKAIDSLEKEKESEVSDEFKRAEIWEIWDKTSKKVLYFSNDYEGYMITEEDPPFSVNGFFPCGKPLFSILTSESLEPVPYYLIYQDQAMELDLITQRLAHLISMIKVAGVYDPAFPAVARLLHESCEGQMMPMDNFLGLVNAGGLSGVMDFLPMKDILTAIQVLTERAAILKSQIDEISAVADITRGYSDPSETATAQKIKSQWVSIRLEDMQKEMARFCRDNIAIMAEIIVEQFSPETIMKIVGTEFLQGDEEISPEQRAMDAIALLKDDKMRTFKIDIETDSTVRTNEKAEQESAGEFIEASSIFLEKMTPFVSQFPVFAPLLGEMLMLGARKYRGGRSIEGLLEKLTRQFSDQLQQPQEPQPDPAQIEAEQKAQEFQANLELERAKMEQELQLQREKMAQEFEIERMKLEQEFALKLEEMSLEKEIRKAEAIAYLQSSRGDGLSSQA